MANEIQLVSSPHEEHDPPSCETDGIQRFATVEEIAHMITYVCSGLSSATNGTALRVDGGVVKSIV